MREWLKDLRKEKGLTQADIANALRIAPNYYNLIENGKRQPKMTIEMAQKLAAIFGVTLEFILENETKN